MIAVGDAAGNQTWKHEWECYTHDDVWRAETRAAA
jgi:hypothetical protein